MIKHTEFRAGVWFILLVIYFIFLNAVVYTGNAAVNNNETVSNNIFIEGSLGLDYGSALCSDPRYKYEPFSSQTEEFLGIRARSMDCENTAGVLNQQTCNNIAGCNWTNITYTKWLFVNYEGASTCLGNINASKYGINTTSSIFGFDVVDYHANTGTFKSPSVCNHPNVIQNSSLCYVFGCTWSPLQLDISANPLTLYDSVKDVFTFSYNYGVSNPFFAFILNIIFVLLPLIALVLSIYFLVR